MVDFVERNRATSVLVLLAAHPSRVIAQAATAIALVASVRRNRRTTTCL
jgi:hypothetical protein